MDTEKDCDIWAGGKMKPTKVGALTTENKCLHLVSKGLQVFFRRV